MSPEYLQKMQISINLIFEHVEFLFFHITFLSVLFFC